MDYVGEQCPICKKTFTENDDVVVCPECGTPHHRACYNANGDCANAEKHGDFAWSGTQKTSEVKNVQNPKKIENKPTHKIVLCPNCGKENPAEEPVCKNCGARLYNNMGEGKPIIPPVELPNGNAQPFVQNGVVAIQPTDMLGDNTVGDSAEFIGVNAHKYIPKLYKMEKEKKKVSWNWSAFLFAPYWFFYRKMHIIGFVIMLIMMTLTGFCTTKNYVTTSNAFMTKAAEFSMGETSQAEVMEEYKALLALPETKVMAIATLGMHLYAGLLGNWHYKRKVEKDVAELRKAAQSPEAYRVMLFRKGGVSGWMLALSYLGYNCAVQVIAFFVTTYILKM